MKKTLLFAILAMACMISCKSQKTDANQEANDTIAVEEAPAEEFINFEGLAGTWYVVEVNGENVVMNDTTPSFTFDLDEMMIHAYAGCNQINGQIERVGRAMNSLSFANTLSTKMACEDEKAEMAIGQALGLVRSFTATQSQLQLQDENAETVMLLKR